MEAILAYLQNKKTAKILVCLLPLILAIYSCSNKVRNDYFEFLFGLADVDVKLVCSNNDLFETGKGYRWEVYQLSDETFKAFTSKFGNSDTLEFPKKNLYSKNYGILTWRRSPVRVSDSSILNAKLNTYKARGASCFAQNMFFNTLRSKDNYYSAYYYHYTNSEVESFSWFVIDSRTKELYIESVEL